jgi:hypothetical protein
MWITRCYKVEESLESQGGVWQQCRAEVSTLRWTRENRHNYISLWNSSHGVESDLYKMYSKTGSSKVGLVKVRCFRKTNGSQTHIIALDDTSIQLKRKMRWSQSTLWQVWTAVSYAGPQKTMVFQQICPTATIKSTCSKDKACWSGSYILSPKAQPSSHILSSEIGHDQSTYVLLS